MAQLDSLLVQGIRSIGPDGSDAHVIKFQNPLTIIAGPNGSGKTTLIEALNFITTDTKPSGQYPAFIHNLEVCGRARVDALVKLKFFAANGKQVTATKRLNLSRAPRTNKITGKQDESTLVIVDQHGQKISLSSKVADTKTEMINLLDVPRAILTNVIFCHQENSTWPLGEPKQVKEKFDAIFELSKYVKILEKLRKMAKDQTQSLNVIHAELNHMQSNYDDRLKKEANREELQDRLLKLKQDLAKYNEKKQEVMHILKEASGKVEVYQGFSNERTLATSKLEMQLEQLKHFDVPDYSGSEEELLEAIQQITDSFEFKNIESRRIAVEKQMAELEASISMLEKQKRSLEAERLDVHTNTKMKEDYVDQIANLQKMIRKEYEFQATDIISAMEAFIEEEGARLEQYRAHQQKERQNLETRKNDLMEKRQKAKHEIRSKKDQEKKLETDIGILNTKINAVSSGQNELQSLQKRIVAIEKERSDLGEVDLSALDKIKQKRDKAQDELTRLKDQCAAAEVFEEAERSLVRLKQEMREAAKKLDELTAKNTADLTLVFDTEDQSFPISASIKDKVVSVRKELDFANKEHNSIEVALELAKSAEQRYTQEQIQLENQIKELEKEIGELTDLTPPEKVSLRLAELRTQLRNNQKELNPLESKFELYETWIEETEAKNCCPLCDRRFASKMAKNELVEKLTNLRVSTPREIERLSEAVTALDDQEKSFAKAEENFQKLNLLTEKLRKLQVERKESESKVTETEKRLKKIKNELTLVQKSSEACNRILVDAAIMDSLDLQIQKAKNDISETEHSLSQRLKAGRGYLELKQERQELEEKISSLLGEGDKLQLEANKRNKLSEELTQLQSQRLVLGDNAANLAHFENQLKEKEEEVAELSSSISSLETLLPELCEEESDAVKAIKVHDKNTKVEEMKKEEQTRELGQYKVDLEKLNKSLECCEKKLEKQGGVQSEYDELNEKMTQASQKLGDLKGQVNAPDHLKEKRRRLEDQRSRMVIMKNVEKCNATLAKEWTGEDIQAIKTAAREAQITHDLCVRRIGEKDGLRKEIEKNLESLKAELNESRFSKSDDKLRKKLVEKVVAECAQEDLKNYATKVEQTLLVFHRSKMEAINEILENLWRRVYRGTDIDTIRIKSELSEGSGARTKYDYQVMMVLENGVEVEMRDRCSAGQKMLASILIRIALSDVFGSQCSILALDEPTTNLDVQKIDDMAAMIIDLINARSVDGGDDDEEDKKPKRRHFQMIIITHDERFVATLKRDVRPEIIYHVSKNEDGKSRIVQETNFGERN